LENFKSKSVCDQLFIAGLASLGKNIAYLIELKDFSNIKFKSVSSKSKIKVF
jgi:hypothetical protein